jgi:hypothetical protein
MHQLKPLRRNGFSVLAIVFILLFVSGCAMTTKIVPEDKRIMLAEKTATSETYSSGPLTVNYEYQRSGDTLTIAGNVEFRQGVDSLDVRIYFLDGEGLVLGRKLVYSSGYRSLATRDSTRTFRTKIDVPAGAVGLTFNESSVARTSQR